MLELNQSAGQDKKRADALQLVLGNYVSKECLESPLDNYIKFTDIQCLIHLHIRQLSTISSIYDIYLFSVACIYPDAQVMCVAVETGS